MARRGNVTQAEAELNALANRLTELATAEQAPVHLVMARAYALCAKAVISHAPAETRADSLRDRIQRCQDQGVSALERCISADPFNATYLGFEIELQPLRDHPRFQELMNRFRNPK